MSTYEIGSKIEGLIESFYSQQEMEKEFHDYESNSIDELELLLSHHKEDLEEYIARGDDEEDINHIREDIKEIEDELKGR